MNTNHFIIAGFQRSGSTLLYNLLDNHPEIQMNKPVKPEPKYFINHSQINKSEYFDTFFKYDEQVKWYGDKSTSYIENVDSIIKFKEAYPTGKIILILRNPVDRAISNYKFSHENGLETRTIEEVFLEEKPSPTTKNKTSVNPFDYIQRGFYSIYIKNILEYIHKDDLLLVSLEKLLNNENEFLKINNFLKIEKFQILESHLITSKVNSTKTKIDISNKVYFVLQSKFQKELSLLNNLNRGNNVYL